MFVRLVSVKQRIVAVLDFARVTAAIAARTLADHWVWERTRGKRKGRPRRAGATG